MLPNQTKATVRWRRFSGASYAVFQSFHREVTIGCLTVAMLAPAMLKAADVTTPQRGVSYDADDSLSVNLDDVEVLATRVPLAQQQAPRLVTVLSAADIAAAAVHSINDLLEYAVGIDVRQRGEMGVQTDISVRGGTFDQITLLLNGINISSPHTGHLTADFPVSMQDIERIEIIEGPASRVFGTSAFTGVINIVTHQDADCGSVHLMGGDFATAGADLRLAKQHRLGKGLMQHRVSGGYNRSDGATPNSDYHGSRAFYQGGYTVGNVPIEWQLGYSYKAYGANTFYGASSTDQWESNERLMAALHSEFTMGKVHVVPTLYWNRWYDHYQWHKDNPAGENFHQVDTYGASVNSWITTGLGKTSLGVEVRNEGIYSTSLGNVLDEADWKKTGGHDGVSDIYYKKQFDRTNVSAFLEHDVLWNQWTLSLGVLANYNSGLDSQWRFYPGVDLAYRPTDHWKLFASWNMALRMPTFTDLYYKNPGIEGSNDLKPEKTNDVSIGARYRVPGWKAESSIFYSHKKDMIDWVIYADDATDTYRSGNFRMDNYGVELAVNFLPAEISGKTCPVRKLGVQYAYIDESLDYDVPIKTSKYAMEYLRHKVVLQVESRLYRKLNLSGSWRWQERVGEGNEPYGLLDARLSWDDSRWSVYADCSNILNKEYYDYSIVRQPGRWFKAGFVWKFGL